MYSVFLSLQCSPTREADVSRAWSRDSASRTCSDTIASIVEVGDILCRMPSTSSRVQLESLLTVLVK